MTGETIIRQQRAHFALEELDADDSEIAKQAQEASVVKLVNDIVGAN